MTTKKVVIDFGHGGSDPGSIGLGIYESVATEITGYKIKKHLEENYDVEVILTRADNQTYPTLAERPQLAKDEQADAFISVHYNVSNGAGYGYEDYRHTNSDTASIDYVLQNAVHQKVAAAILPLGGRDRGMKQADDQVLRDLQGSGIPAILIEGCFIDNTSDIELFMSAEYMDAYTSAVAEGIAEAVQADKIVLVNEGTIDFVGKVKGDGDASRIIKYTGSYTNVAAPTSVITEANGGYAGASAEGGTTCYYSITGGTAGRHVQFDFEFVLDKFGTRDELVQKLTQIQFNELVANTSAFTRNSKHQVQVWNVTQQAWTDVVVHSEETTGVYVALTLNENFADYIDSSNKIIFAISSVDVSDANELRVETDRVFLSVTTLK